MVVINLTRKQQGKQITHPCAGSMVMINLIKNKAAEAATQIANVATPKRPMAGIG